MYFYVVIVFSTSLSSNQKNKKIFLTYTNLETDDDLDVLREMVHLFNIHVNTMWSERITHLVVKTGNDGSCLRTKKYLNALLSNCYIVVLDWAKDCLSRKTLLPEVFTCNFVIPFSYCVLSFVKRLIICHVMHRANRLQWYHGVSEEVLLIRRWIGLVIVFCIVMSLL